ncbi:CDP-alcohol phosphatidyltransferase family protein [Sphingomonas sp. CROZ-RG-20F-R02-07]|uniref:CDP-alcohol phosphatidyltransferase family protein n=1 Tax=Sphingomonas sp. CROZ-RG-20F-R02-07 TaxID=2914832 RepID=UPI001F562909|nr:CDP-alcohol phosphatidyltransferase family protein [Sphingomonas sp. CROZ-RG-20F-R02-07]
MTSSSPDGSRDPRIEDPSNLRIIHPAARALLPSALALGLSANLVSLIGLMLGIGAAAAYARWESPWAAMLGLILSIGWLIADGLDGMVARATGTSSAIGRMLDGLVDHGVFILIYVRIALGIGTVEGWILAISAGVAHMVQSSLYEGERARFHRRVRGEALIALPRLSRMPLVMLYDWVSTSFDRLAQPFERLLARSPDPRALGRAYGDAAVPPMRAMAWLSANVRVAAVFLACLVGNPRYFWWFEIVVLTPIAIATMIRHRRVEHGFVHGPAAAFAGDDRLAPAFSSKEHRH